MPSIRVCYKEEQTWADKVSLAVPLRLKLD